MEGACIGVELVDWMERDGKTIELVDGIGRDGKTIELVDRIGRSIALVLLDGVGRGSGGVRLVDGAAGGRRRVEDGAGRVWLEGVKFGITLLIPHHPQISIVHLQ